MKTLFLALQPLFTVGGSAVLSWLLSFCIIAAIVYLIIWLVTKVAGPVNIPEPFRWVIWIVVAIALIIFIFAAFGIHLP